MFLDSLHECAPKRNAIFLELYNVAKSVDPEIDHENRPQSSDSASTNLSGSSNQSKSETAIDKLASTVIQQAMLAVPQEVTWAPDHLSFFRGYLWIPPGLTQQGTIRNTIRPRTRNDQMHRRRGNRLHV